MAVRIANDMLYVKRITLSVFQLYVALEILSGREFELDRYLFQEPKSSALTES